MLNLTRLRVLAAVAEHGSVTAAAKALHYAQPSISHHLSRLEAETGAVLIRRAGRGIRLTRDGQLLAQRATEILGRVDAAESELASRTGLHHGQVRVAAFQSALSVWVPLAAARLRERHPGLELTLEDCHPRVALDRLRQGEVDLAVVFFYDDGPPDDGIHYRHLADDPMYLLSRRQRDTLARHHDSAWIAGCEYCRRDFLDLCQTAGFTPNIAYVSDDMIVEQHLVATGLGVTTMPGLALRAFRVDGIRSTKIPGHRRRIYVATYGEPPDPPATAAFIAELMSVAA